mgnify:CR=1 FL=1
MSFFEVLNLYNDIFYKSLSGVKLSFLEKKFLNAYISLYFYGKELHYLNIKEAKKLQKELKKKLEGS